MLHLFTDKHPRQTWTNSDKLLLAEALQAYMGGCSLTREDPYHERARQADVNGRTIQYVEEVTTTTVNGVDYGFQEEIVWVGKRLPEGDRVFLGMNWNTDTNTQIWVIDNMDYETLHSIITQVSIHRVMGGLR